MNHRVWLSSRVALLAMGMTLFTAGGWAQESKTPEPAKTAEPAAKPDAAPSVPPDKVVIRVGGQPVTAGDFDFLLSSLPPGARQMAMSQGSKPLAEQYALMMALSQKATADHLDQDADFQRRMTIQRNQWLAQAEYKDLSGNVKVTPEDVQAYYDAHKSDLEELEIRQITVRKKEGDAKNPPPGLSEADARAKIEAIRKELMAGTDPKKVEEDFKMANVIFVDANSHDIRRNQFPKDVDAKIFALKNGEVSEPFESPGGFYCIQVVQHKEPTLADATKEIEGKMREQKIQAALDDVKTKANIWLDDDFFKVAPHPAPAAAAAPPSTPAATPQHP